MEDVFPGRLPVEVVEDALVVAAVVNRQALRRIQKMSRSNAAQSYEVSVLRSTDAECNIPSAGSERAPLGVDIAERLGHAQPGPAGGIHNQAGLIAILRIRRSRNQFHALKGDGGNLRGEELALLVADGLAIDEHQSLSVVSEGVKETIGVGGDASAAVRNGLV